MKIKNWKSGLAWTAVGLALFTIALVILTRQTDRTEPRDSQTDSRTHVAELLESKYLESKVLKVPVEPTGDTTVEIIGSVLEKTGKEVALILKVEVGEKKFLSVVILPITIELEEDEDD